MTRLGNLLIRLGCAIQKHARTACPCEACAYVRDDTGPCRCGKRKHMNSDQIAYALAVQECEEYEYWEQRKAEVDAARPLDTRKRTRDR